MDARSKQDKSSESKSRGCFRGCGRDKEMEEQLEGDPSKDAAFVF